VFVPLILYFVIMWTGTFVALFLLGRRERWEPVYAYQSAVVQVSAGRSGITGSIMGLIRSWDLDLPIESVSL
jgi:hypothetical protein